ncbi:MAG: copper resistance protein CopZ [Marinosulfonomonas sp.]|nr:MAG: copper resistance protein CopZ [Marinosulfonomonas sp.]
MKYLIPAMLLLLAACKEDQAASQIPGPVELTQEAAGYYCQMVILEHQGPKAQVHLEGMFAPLWFSQVRDGIAYLKSPEQSAEILVLYVNDMGRATSWSEIGEGNWIIASDAYFVIGSDAIGGMGAPEVVPFGNQADADAFADEHGGEVMRLDDIPTEAVLGPVEFGSTALETSE